MNKYLSDKHLQQLDTKSYKTSTSDGQVVYQCTGCDYLNPVKYLLQIIWNSITCPPLSLVLFVVTYVLPEMLSKYTDTGSIRTILMQILIFSELGDLVHSK